MSDTPPIYVRAAALFAAGLTPEEVKERLGLRSAANARVARSRARLKGLLPTLERPPRKPPAPKAPRSKASPANHYHYLRGQGAVPPTGSLGGFLNALTDKERRRLYNLIATDDATLADTLVRLLREGPLDTRRR
jgi:hypothetical protein